MLLGKYTSFTFSILDYLQIGNDLNRLFRRHVVQCLVIDVAHALVAQVGGILLINGQSHYVFREYYEVRKFKWKCEWRKVCADLACCNLLLILYNLDLLMRPSNMTTRFGRFFSLTKHDWGVKITRWSVFSQSGHKQNWFDAFICLNLQYYFYYN